MDVLRWLSSILLRRMGKIEIIRRNNRLSTGSQWKPKNGMTASRNREFNSRALDGEPESEKHNYLWYSRLRRILFYWHHSCVSSLNMAIKQNARRREDSIFQDQNSPSRSRKSAKYSRVRKLEERSNGPLNVLGCLALIHAIRSANSSEQPQVSSGRAMVA
jgi:hypothetical protein